jgi:hypothetical protein
MRKLLLIVILGLWPLWVAVVWVIAGARHFAGSANDYWSAAPWIIVVSIPVCVVTTVMAFAANYVFHRSEGGPLRKFILAALVYLGAVLLLGIYGRSLHL